MNNINPLYYLTEIEEKQISQATNSTYKKLREKGLPENIARLHVKTRLKDLENRHLDKANKTIAKANAEARRVAYGGKLNKDTMRMLNGGEMAKKNRTEVRRAVDGSDFN